MYQEWSHVAHDFCIAAAPIEKVDMANESTEFVERRRKAKGGGGRLPPEKQPRIRAGRLPAQSLAAIAAKKKAEELMLTENLGSEDDVPDEEDLTPRRKQLFSPQTGEPARSKLFGPIPGQVPPATSPPAPAPAKVQVESSESSSKRPPPILGVPTFSGTFVEANESLDLPTSAALIGTSLGTSLSILNGSPLKAAARAGKSPMRLQQLQVSPAAAESRAQREARLAVASGGRIDSAKGASC